MGREVLSILTILIVVTCFMGCASMSDVVKAKQEGTVQVYYVNKEQAWEIALTVFRWEGSYAIEEHRTQNYMLTSSGMNIVSAGTVMGHG